VVSEHEGKRITAVEIISNSLFMGIWIIFDNRAGIEYGLCLAGQEKSVIKIVEYRRTKKNNRKDFRKI
jgi:hypothetical protein